MAAGKRRGSLRRLQCVKIKYRWSIREAAIYRIGANLEKRASDWRGGGEGISVKRINGGGGDKLRNSYLRKLRD